MLGSLKVPPLQNPTFRRRLGVYPVEDFSAVGGLFPQTLPCITFPERNSPPELHIVRLQPRLPTKGRLEGVRGECGLLSARVQRRRIASYTHSVVCEGERECNAASNE